MADVAGFGLDVRGQIDFRGLVRKFDFSCLVVYSDILYFGQPSDVHDDLVDVIPGIEHHGIMCSQPDSGSKPIGGSHNVPHFLFFLVAHIDLGPG